MKNRVILSLKHLHWLDWYLVGQTLFGVLTWDKQVSNSGDAESNS